MSNDQEDLLPPEISHNDFDNKNILSTQDVTLKDDNDTCHVRHLQSNSGSKTTARSSEKMRPKLNQNNIYIPIKVNGFVMYALVDTGAQASVISEKFAQQLNLRVTETMGIKGISDGSNLKAKFCPEVNIEIGNITFKTHVVVAPINEDYVIGMDLIFDHDLDVIVSDGVVVVGNERIKFVQNKPGSSKYDVEIKRITLHQQFKIPA